MRMEVFEMWCPKCVKWGGGGGVKELKSDAAKWYDK